MEASILPRSTRARRPAKWLLVVACSLSPLLGGCSKGADEDGEGGGSTGNPELAKIAAEEQKEAAVKADAQKYSPKMFSEAEERLAQAEDLFLQGNPKAAQRYNGAKSRFKDAIKDAKQNQQAYNVANARKLEYETAKENATKLEIATLAPDLLKKAEEYYAEGKAEMQDATKFKKAAKTFGYGISELVNFVENAKAATAARAKAEEFLADMEVMKKKAVEVKAEELALSTFNLGAEAEREGRGLLGEGNFDRARNSFKAAKDWYTMAVEDSLEKTRQPVVAAATPEADKPDQREQAPEVARITPPKPEPAAVDVTDAALKIFSVQPSFQGGFVTLNYANGRDLRKDSFWSRDVVTEGDKRTLIFEGRNGVGFFARGELGETDESEEEEEMPDYSFHGNTHGQLVINAKFENYAKVEFDVAFQLLIPDNPYFQVLINYDGKEDFYATNLGYQLLLAESKRETKVDHSKVLTSDKRPHLWVKKTTPYHYRVIYKKAEEDKKGSLKVYVNELETFSVETNKYQEGYIGWRWNDMRFVVFNLAVSGRLDEEWAIQEAEKRGNAPKPSAGEGF